MINDIIQLLQSGFSKRFHSNPDMADKADDLAQHQWSVAMILLFLKPDCSKELLVEALTHDVGEMVAGDLSYDFKINNKEIAELHKKLEVIYRNRIISTKELFFKDDINALQLSDWLSAYWWVGVKNPSLLYRNDWLDQRKYFKNLATKTPFEERVLYLADTIENIASSGSMHKIDLGWSFIKGLKEYDAA